jgi:SAM-dependent methyltransferase
MGLLLHRAKLAVKRRLATPTLRRLLRRPEFTLVREELARRFLRGSGIEVGALNQPLPVPEAVSVRYVDRAPLATLRSYHGQGVSTIRAPDLVDDLENLCCIGDGTVDFVIANHVLEHVENPLRALATISRVLVPNGIAYVTLPDKRFTFDKRRALTPLSHILRDYRDGPAWSRHDHFVEWARNVEGASDVEARARELESDCADIHFHVWDFSAMREMFAYACNLGLLVEHARQNRTEIIWLLRHQPGTSGHAAGQSRAN